MATLMVGILVFVGTFQAANESTAVLIKSLESGDYKIWQPAVEELVKKGPVAIPAVLDALTNKNWNMRRCAVIIVGRWKEPKAIPALMANLKLGSGNILFDPSIKSLQQIGPPATPGLIQALTSSDADMRYGAALALEGVQDEQAVAGLLAAIKSPDAEVRRHAARTLGRRKDASAVGPLLAMLGEGDSAVRLAAVDVLGAIQEPRTVEPLTALFKSGDDTLRRAAALAVGNIDTDESLAALDANKDIPAVADVLKQVDMRGKPIQQGNGVEVTLIGIERTAEYPGLSLKCSSKDPCEFAVVRVRVKNLDRRDRGLMVTGALIDAKGKSQVQLQVPISDLAAPGNKQSFTLVYVVPREGALKTFQLLGATFDLVR